MVKYLVEHLYLCQASMTRMCARLEIRTGRLAHVRARAVRAKCSLAGFCWAPRASLVACKQVEPGGTRQAGLTTYISARVAQKWDGRSQRAEPQGYVCLKPNVEPFVVLFKA